MDGKHIEHTSSSMRVLVERIINAVKDSGDAEIARFKKDNTIDPETAKMLNEERQIRREVMTKVCEHIVETASTLKHDENVEHSIPIDNVPLHLIDRKAVGKCLKCSLLYYVNVLYVREFSEDMMIPQLPVERKIYYTRNTNTANYLLGDSEDEKEMSISDVASRFLEDSE